MVGGRTSKIIVSLTLCDDGTRAVSTWSPPLQHWQTTINASPRPGRTRMPHTTG